MHICKFYISAVLLVTVVGSMLAVYRVFEHLWIIGYSSSYNSTIYSEISSNISDEAFEDDDYEVQTWETFKEKSYFFGNLRKRGWELAEEFCKKNNASLLIIDEKDELDFISNKSIRTAWVGLRQESHKKWFWTNGAMLNAILFPGGVTQEKDKNECANVMHNKLFAAPCKSASLWICERNDVNQ
ncbi:early activation antigen CD69-like [Erpetoichthys calabaricus]|uniref:early activation antigen CD69-like n=1 Tax=Erpetoichthys calabaricus TaxID=27687 RepID=UPI00109FD1C1|nr:early activation antigen CD69-like [Erpetoichthys calabaricus]XP_028664799.1 early activation antigen CD69-like [Erpetoichthys calabaricus]